MVLGWRWGCVAQGGRLPPRRKRAQAVVQPHSFGKWVIQNCVQHLLNSRRSSQGARVFGVVLDGAMVGRRKHTVYLGYNPANRIRTVGAPQELRFCVCLRVRTDRRLSSVAQVFLHGVVFLTLVFTSTAEQFFLRYRCEIGVVSREH